MSEAAAGCADCNHHDSMALLLTCFKSLLHSVACKLLIASTASSKQPARCCAGMVRVPLLLCGCRCATAHQVHAKTGGDHSMATVRLTLSSFLCLIACKSLML